LCYSPLTLVSLSPCVCVCVYMLVCSVKKHAAPLSYNVDEAAWPLLTLWNAFTWHRQT